MEDVMSDPAASPGKGWNIGIWVVQAMLGLSFAVGGFMKLVLPVATLLDMGVDYAGALPLALLRFIGAVEFAGGIGVILPAALRIKPTLTPMAAAGLALIMVLAAGFHITRAEWSDLPANMILAAMAAFVIWGRLKKAPIKPRG
jgi:putative oxidoreductase